MADRVIYLPSTDHLPEDRRRKVILKDNISGGHLLEFTEAGSLAIPRLIAEGIQSWNISGDDGELLPITPANVGQLGSADIWHIGENLYKSDDDSKEFDQEIMLALVGASETMPWALFSYKYRQIFQVSWPEFAATPLKVIQRDLKIYDLEKQRQASQPELQEHPIG